MTAAFTVLLNGMRRLEAVEGPHLILQK